MGFFTVKLGGQALRRPPQGAVPLAVTTPELIRIGIPARKIDRVLSELQKLADADPALNHKTTLLRLAKNLQGAFL